MDKYFERNNLKSVIFTIYKLYFNKREFKKREIGLLSKENKMYEL